MKTCGINEWSLSLQSVFFTQNIWTDISSNSVDSDPTSNSFVKVGLLYYYHKCPKILYTNFSDKMAHTVLTQIRLLLQQEHSDLGLHCLPYH